MIRHLALAVLLGVALMSALGLLDRAAPPMLVGASIAKADYPMCVRVQPPPLRPQRRFIGIPPVLETV